MLTENSFNFLGFALLDERVEDDNVLALSISVSVNMWLHLQYGSAYEWKTEEVSVAVGAALRAVNLVQVLERELEPRCERFNAGAQFTLREWRQLVEQRLNNRRVQDDHRQLEDQPEHALVRSMVTRARGRKSHRNAISHGTKRFPSHLKM